jgi:hypothetical protein
VRWLHHGQLLPEYALARLALLRKAVEGGGRAQVRRVARRARARARLRAQKRMPFKHEQLTERGMNIVIAPRRSSASAKLCR